MVWHFISSFCINAIVLPRHIWTSIYTVHTCTGRERGNEVFYKLLSTSSLEFEHETSSDSVGHQLQEVYRPHGILDVPLRASQGKDLATFARRSSGKGRPCDGACVESGAEEGGRGVELLGLGAAFVHGVLARGKLVERRDLLLGLGARENDLYWGRKEFKGRLKMVSHVSKPIFSSTCVVNDYWRNGRLWMLKQINGPIQVLWIVIIITSYSIRSQKSSK